MTFSQDVKSEIVLQQLKACDQRAQLSALLSLCGSYIISSNRPQLLLVSENSQVIKQARILVFGLYKAQSQITVVRKMKLKKNNQYQLRITSEVERILAECGLWGANGLRAVPLASLLKKECCQRAYIAGAFLAGGSVNSPHTSNYHLEIAANSEALAGFIQKQLIAHDLPARTITRRGQFVVYLKASEKISDFLRWLNLSGCVMTFEDERIKRDFYNNLNRLDNFEVANNLKAMSTGLRQVADIELIQKYLPLVKPEKKLLEVMELRLDFPEHSLKELCLEYLRRYHHTISKSGMKHRLAKISNLALEVQKRIQ
ncbi:MAG: DNA-binding protein WhiA [Erysipelotrichaceae bacterium]|jgi:DNA-binding protein WhiA|nr:DNA-binding protein WhiA [Erysipelotrichaceae bacterium]